jgi:hypothetical protein
MTSRSVPLLAVIGTLIVVIAFGLAGYAVGKNGAPDEKDAAAERAAGRREVLSDAETAAQRERREAVDREETAGERRGRRAGETEGNTAGEAELAARDVGPTTPREPRIPADVLSGGQFTERPGAILLGPHHDLVAISWSETGGEVAIGMGTLVVTGCEPTCAEGSVKRASATVKAWEPVFNSDNVRFYSKITVEPSNAEKLTYSISPF